MKFDRTGRRQELLQARAAESSYSTRLRQVAKQIDAIVKGLAPDGRADDRVAARIMSSLQTYSQMLDPWAHSVARYMVADVSRRNAAAWKRTGIEISQALRVELEQAPTGATFQRMMNEQVKLITSIPLDAARRVHELTAEARLSGSRAESLSAEIMRTGEVSKSKATLIARTEVSRTASNFTQARARFAGSDGYIWRTSRDGSVRDTHREQEGRYVRWDSPPKTDKGLAPYHAGCGPNCRCYPDPVLPDL